MIIDNHVLMRIFFLQTENNIFLVFNSFFFTLKLSIYETGATNGTVLDECLQQYNHSIYSCCLIIVSIICLGP